MLASPTFRFLGTKHRPLNYIRILYKCFFAANLGIMAKMSNIVSENFLESDLYLHVVAGPLFSRVRRPLTSNLKDGEKWVLLNIKPTDEHNI